MLKKRYDNRLLMKNKNSRFSYHVNDDIIWYNSLEVERSAARLFLLSSSYVQKFLARTAVYNRTLPGNVLHNRRRNTLENKIYTPRQAWEQLGIGRTRFYQFLKEGKIRHFKNGRRFLITEGAITEFIEEQTEMSSKAGEQ